MDVSLFESQLSAMLGDSTNATYPASLVQTAMVLSVRAYQRYFPNLKPFGSGHVYQNVSSGGNTILVVGGPWTIGKSVIVDFGAAQETFTITGIANGTSISNWMGKPIQLTLSGNLAYAHSAGAVVIMSTPALNLVANQNTYALPYDFISFDQKTFDLANGSRSWTTRRESFYDGVYAASDRLSGVGYGQSQNFSGLNSTYGQYNGMGAVPNAPNAFIAPSGGASDTLFTVTQGNPPLLNIAPTPMAAATWPFNYYATHQPETVPDEDFDALLDCGKMVASNAIRQQNAGLLKLGDIRQNIDPEGSQISLLKIAEEAIESWKAKIVNRPYLVSG
jgi:hypothetical protein